MSFDIELPPVEGNGDDEVLTGEEEAARLAAEAEKVPQRSFKKLNDASYGECFLYTFQVRMDGEGVSSITQLLHKDQIPAAKLQEMCTEVAGIVRTRVQKRRRTMVLIPQPVKDPDQTNERFYDQDLVFWEGVMCDKFAFRKQLSEGCVTSIEPTFQQVNGVRSLVDPGPMEGIDDQIDKLRDYNSRP